MSKKRETKTGHTKFTFKCFVQAIGQMAASGSVDTRVSICHLIDTHSLAG